MDVCLVIKQRLEELGFEQRDLAAAAEVTESYISQLLTRKKSPPAPRRTDIYDKMAKFLKLPSGELSKLADHERREQLKKTLGHAPPPLFKEVRELVLRKCTPDKEKQFRVIFEKHPFGEVERLVIQKLLDVAKRVAKEELESENWVHQVARLTGRSYEEMRVSILEFLDTDALNLSVENCATFLDPLIESWDFDLATFGMEIVLNGRLAPGDPKKFEFVEREPGQSEEERGLKEFLRDTSLSRGATEEEIQFLKRLRIKGKRPTALYYYRELQNLRDPLNFRDLLAHTPQTKIQGESQPDGSVPPTHKYHGANGTQKQLQLDGGKRAIRHWAGNKGSRGKKTKGKAVESVSRSATEPPLLPRNLHKAPSLCALPAASAESPDGHAAITVTRDDDRPFQILSKLF